MRFARQKIVFLLLSISFYTFSQKSPKQLMLDSINNAREKDRGVFKLYIKKFKGEIIPGFYNTRETTTPDFKPFSTTYNIYLPFQLDLSYLNMQAKDKLLKLNSVIAIQHSNYGNYAIGLSERFSFLLLKKTYLSYQIGVVWVESTSKKAPDGLTNMGFCFHHNFALSYRISKHFEFSLNAIHISNGAIFKNAKNLQDVLGVGLAYQL